MPILPSLNHYLSLILSHYHAHVKTTLFWPIELPNLKGIWTWLSDIQPPTIRCPFCKCMIETKEKYATRTTTWSPRDPLEQPDPAYYLLDIYYRNYTLYLIELPCWVHCKRLCNQTNLWGKLEAEIFTTVFLCDSNEKKQSLGVFKLLIKLFLIISLKFTVNGSARHPFL